MGISDRLDQIEQRYGDVSIADASRYTLIGKDVPDLIAALRAVLNLHSEQAEPGFTSWCDECSDSDDEEGCSPAIWPCPTVKAIAAALNAQEGTPNAH